MELKFYSHPPHSISHNILLQQTEAVVLPLSTRIMIRLKALTGETWTNARWWEQFAAQSTVNKGGRSAPLATDNSREGLRSPRREGWKHPNPKKQLVIQQFLLSDSITFPLSLSFFLSASNQVLLPVSLTFTLKKKTQIVSRWPFLEVLLFGFIHTNTHAHSHKI